MDIQESKIGDLSISYRNREEFLSLKKEIFVEEIYDINLSSQNPTIIDAGAYIGMATLYFRQRYPDSKIISIEPNPSSAELLKTNLMQNNIARGVEIHEVALAGKEGVREFFIGLDNDGWDSTAGLFEGTWKGYLKTSRVVVDAIPLSQYLTERIDLLKIDIEGAEVSVLKESQDKLHLVDNIIMEFHPIEGRSPDSILKILRKSGFAIVSVKDVGDGLKVITASKPH